MDTICIYDSIILYGQSGDKYLWSTGDTTTNIIISPDSNANYELEVTSLFGCTNKTNKKIYVNKLPFIEIIGDSIICEGEELILLAKGEGKFNWGNLLIESINISPLNDTLVILSIIDSNLCINYDSIDIIVNDLPLINIAGTIANIAQITPTQTARVLVATSALSNHLGSYMTTQNHGAITQAHWPIHCATAIILVRS